MHAALARTTAAGTHFWPRYAGIHCGQAAAIDPPADLKMAVLMSRAVSCSAAIVHRALRGKKLASPPSTSRRPLLTDPQTQRSVLPRATLRRQLVIAPPADLKNSARLRAARNRVQGTGVMFRFYGGVSEWQGALAAAFGGKGGCRRREPPLTAAAATLVGRWTLTPPHHPPPAAATGLAHIPSTRLRCSHNCSVCAAAAMRGQDWLVDHLKREGVVSHPQGPSTPPRSLCH